MVYGEDRPMNSKARILLFTGDGKGKTTAALGIVLRAVGHQMATCIIQFIKHDGSTGEIAALGHLPHVSIQQMGLGFVPSATHSAFLNHRFAAREALKTAQAIIRSRHYQVVVFDEICNAIARKLITQKAVVTMLKSAPGNKIIVLTGRGAPKSLIDVADTVTEMKCIKHGFQKGRLAEKGAEF